MSTNIKKAVPVLGAVATVGAAYFATKIIRKEEDVKEDVVQSKVQVLKVGDVEKKGEVEVGKNEKQEQNVEKKGEEEVGKNEKQEQNLPYYYITILP